MVMIFCCFPSLFKDKVLLHIIREEELTKEQDWGGGVGGGGGKNKKDGAKTCSRKKILKYIQYNCIFILYIPKSYPRRDSTTLLITARFFIIRRYEEEQTALHASLIFCEMTLTRRLMASACDSPSSIINSVSSWLAPPPSPAPL